MFGKRERIILYDGRYYIQYNFLFWWLLKQYYVSTAIDGSAVYKKHGFKSLEEAENDLNEPKERVKEIEKVFYYEKK